MTTQVTTQAPSESTTAFTVIADGHFELVDKAHGIVLNVSRLRRERHELAGELKVTSRMLGTRSVDGVLSIGSFNLSSPRARQERAKVLSGRARAPKVDFAGLLEELCQRVLLAEREGRPALLLRDIPRPTSADVFEIDGLVLLGNHPVILFGDGGASKSYLALYVAGHLARSGLSVLFADWELAGEDHRDRLERLFGRNMPPVLYARCDRPLTAEVDRLARLRERHRVDYLVCDSIAFACDGPPEAAEVAARYFQCIRQIGVGSLHLAHTNRSERSDEKPFGSSFWHNGARATWHVKLAEGSDAGRLTVGLYNRKSNLGASRPAVGFELTFSDERTEIRRVEVGTHSELAASLPLWQRIRHAVQSSPQTLSTIAEECGAKVDSIDRIVRRHKKLFVRVSGEDGISRIALVERQSA